MLVAERCMVIGKAHVFHVGSLSYQLRKGNYMSVIELDFLDKQITEIFNAEIEMDENKFILVKKIIEEERRNARMSSKGNRCYLCNKRVDSFCKSHTIPQFCLRNISDDGKLYNFNKFIDNKILHDKDGVNKIETFSLICRDCDSKYFNDYESENKITNPSERTYHQIAIKNIMLMLYKRRYEKCLYKKLNEDCGNEQYFLLNKIKILKLDILEYKKQLKTYIRNNKKEPVPEQFNKVVFMILPYVVPLSFQGIIAPVMGFDREIINDLNNTNKKYKIEILHAGIFPLESKSVILLFTDRRYRRCRKFINKIKGMSRIEQLNIINKLIFLYNEEIYLSPKCQIFNKEEDFEKLKNIARINPTTFWGENKEEVNLNNIRFVVEEVDKNRIKKVRIYT